MRSNQVVSFAEKLRELLRYGDCEELSRVLCERPGVDLEPVQVYRKVSHWKSDPHGQRLFNVACELLVEVPELLEAVASRAGFYLVGKPEGAEGLRNLLAAVAEAQREEADSVSQIMAAIDPEGPGGIDITEEELAGITESLDKDEKRIEAVRALVTRLGGSGR